MLIVLIWFSLFICWCSLILVVHGLPDCGGIVGTGCLLAGVWMVVVVAVELFCGF